MPLNFRNFKTPLFNDKTTFCHLCKGSMSHTDKIANFQLLVEKLHDKKKACGILAFTASVTDITYGLNPNQLLPS
jgi:hypothetical protein